VNSPTSSISIARQPGTAVSSTGVEWIVDASECQARLLTDLTTLRSICESVIADLGLQVIGEPQCHVFPDPGGVTCLYLLSESHLACHTYPEYQFATFNLYCCRHREPWSWGEELATRLGSRHIEVQQVKRGPTLDSTSIPVGGDDDQ